MGNPRCSSVGGRDPAIVRPVLGTSILGNSRGPVGDQRTRHNGDSQIGREPHWGSHLNREDFKDLDCRACDGLRETLFRYWALTDYNFFLGRDGSGSLGGRRGVEGGGGAGRGSGTGVGLGAGRGISLGFGIRSGLRSLSGIFSGTLRGGISVNITARIGRVNQKTTSMDRKSPDCSLEIS